MRREWCHCEESNPGPTVYKAVALPTELQWHSLVWLREADSNRRPIGYEPIELPLLHRAKLVCVAGFEPATPAFQGRYSDQTELHTDPSPLGDDRSCSGGRSQIHERSLRDVRSRVNA